MNRHKSSRSLRLCALLFIASPVVLLLSCAEAQILDVEALVNDQAIAPIEEVVGKNVYTGPRGRTPAWAGSFLLNLDAESGSSLGILAYGGASRFALFLEGKVSDQSIARVVDAVFVERLSELEWLFGGDGNLNDTLVRNIWAIMTEVTEVDPRDYRRLFTVDIDSKRIIDISDQPVDLYFDLWQE